VASARAYPRPAAFAHPDRRAERLHESIDLLLDSATRAPVSFYTYAVRKVEKDPANPFSDGTLRASAYYPFCDYSPNSSRCVRDGRRERASNSSTSPSRSS